MQNQLSNNVFFRIDEAFVHFAHLPTCSFYRSTERFISTQDININWDIQEIFSIARSSFHRLQSQYILLLRNLSLFVIYECIKHLLTGRIRCFMKQYRLLALYVGSRLPNRAMNSLALSPLDQQFNEDKRLPCQRLKKWRGTDEGGYTGCGERP
jgi:hypothetical protein